MARIKKPGLDYFPLDTQFVNNRAVRRIMKHRGDGALAVLLHVYSAIYAGKGYYVEATGPFFEDVADCLFTQDTDDVRQVVRLALDYGLFHAGLYERFGILTSEGIQRQYVFSAKRRSSVQIDGRFCLLPPDEVPVPAGTTDAQGGGADRTMRDIGVTLRDNPRKSCDIAGPVVDNPGNVPEIAETVTEMPINATEMPINAGKTYPGTHSIVQHSTEQHSIAHPLPPTASPAGGGTRPSPPCPAGGAAPAARKARVYTQEDIDALTPPPDGLPRNLDGLRENLRLWHVPLPEQYAIVLKSNFGAIGHPLWKGFYALRASHGKIRQPGKYLLSLCVDSG